MLVLAAGPALSAVCATPAAAAEDWPTKPLSSSTMDWKVSADLGYRTLDVEGSEELFRSHTNIDQGVRLFGLSLRGTPKGATSRFMDSLEIDASGIGGDPQEWARFTMRKRGAYRWDVRFNQSDYFFNVPDFVRFGQHTNANDRRSFDTLLELNPGNTRVYVGYVRREFNGPAFLTQDEARDEFLVFAPVDRRTNDARAGIDLKAGAWDLSLEQAYRKLDSRSEFELPSGAGAGNNSTNNATLASFLRDVPLDGTYWISRASAHAAFADRVDLSVRLVRSQGKTDGSSAQSATGTWFTAGAPMFTETVDSGIRSDLPSSLGELGVSVRLTDRVYINNNFRYQHYEIEGNTDETADLLVSGSPPQPSDESFKRLTHWTSAEGRTEVEWRASPHWTLRGGYRRLERDVTLKSTETDNLAATSTVDRDHGDQASNTFFGNAAYRWNRKWSAFVEYQDGQVDNVFLRVDPSDFRLARLRGTYRPTDRWAFSLSALYRHGENPNPDVENQVDSRTYAISSDYTGKRLAFSTGYTAASLGSTTDIVYRIGATDVSDISSWQFFDNYYFANVNYRFSERFKGSLRGQMTDSRGTFPVDYYFVEPRLSVRIYSGYWFNVGVYRYQFDRGQDNTQDYRAEGALISLAADF